MDLLNISDERDLGRLAGVGPSRRPPIMLIGATSILGFNVLLRGGGDVYPVANPNNRLAADRGWERLEAANAAAVEALLARQRPDIVLYSDAVCDVSKCETNPRWARSINVENLEILLASLAPTTRLVYVSSDHVFGGDGVYDETSTVAPISVYGETRVEAEERVFAHPGSLLIRVGLPVGRSLDGRTGHLDWLRYRQRRGLPMTIIRDERRSAVWAEDAADRILALAKSNVIGCRHLVATESVLRPDLAAALLGHMGLSPCFEVAGRAQQPYPHLGEVELATVFEDALATPLEGAMARCVHGLPS